MIRASHLGAIAERPQVVKQHEAKTEPKVTTTICRNCKYQKKIAVWGMCDACCSFWRRNGKMRPAGIIRRAAAREGKAKWCKTCGHTKIKANQRCATCYRYWLLTGKARPKWFWDEDYCCSVCDFPKAAVKTYKQGRKAFYGDKCSACYRYQYRYNKPRPSHLWGKGTHGWCECGSPAEHQINKIAMCNRCVKDYR